MSNTKHKTRKEGTKINHRPSNEIIGSAPITDVSLTLLIRFGALLWLSVGGQLGPLQRSLLFPSEQDLL